MTKHFIITTAAILAGLVLTAAPAFADPPPLPPPSSGSVNVTGTVNAAITLSFTGLSPSIAFPAVYGGTASVPNAENYHVRTTDTNGFTLSVAPGTAAGMSDGSGNFIPNSNLEIMETGGPVQEQLTFTNNSTAGMQIYSGGGTDDQNFVESWNETIPSGQPAGNYAESFTYLAVGN